MEYETNTVNQNVEKTINEQNNCPVTNVLNLLKGKYKLPIIEFLRTGEMERFGALRRKLDNVAQATLTIQLRELERDGILKRMAYAESPPRVEYALSELGESLLPLIDVLGAWNEHYCLGRKVLN
ncbi:winged helix-turn-helix transcriptional regulator [Pedobacter sp. AW31-3R]|uniref:winged helix-turn-helix transcriptional regulator n=1 Tax=Pedobacter sp. AW31-3R TaxID=3445781 RepID=UPI003FA13100